MSREFKYQNESGTKVGRWYLNRLDYFEFYSFVGKWQMMTKCLLVIFGSAWLVSYLPLVFALPLVWAIYVACLCLYIFTQKRCRYRGYFLFPSRFVHFFWEYRKAIEVDDFDSLATAEKAGQSKGIAKRAGTYNRYH